MDKNCLCNPITSGISTFSENVCERERTFFDLGRRKVILDMRLDGSQNRSSQLGGKKILDHNGLKL
jgi:hypothetical protein